MEEIMKAILYYLHNNCDGNESIQNDQIIFFRHCYCEKCDVCKGDMPNFQIPFTGLEINWYKYPSRGFTANRAVTKDDIEIAISALDKGSWVIDGPDESSGV